MALTVDQVLERVGSFGLYQIRLLCVLSFLIWVPNGFQVMLLTFIGAEPGWKCVTNSTKCNRIGTFSVGDDIYQQRYSMNRSDWTFTNEFTSIVTEVSAMHFSPINLENSTFPTRSKYNCFCLEA